MSHLPVYIVVGIYAAGFMTIWFTTVYTELSAKRNSLADLDELLRLHEGLYAKTRKDPDMRCANGMVEISGNLWRGASQNYNCILNKPMNRIPALLMGFRAVDEERKPGKYLKTNMENKRREYKL